MTTTFPLRLGIGLDAAAHARSGQPNWRDFWNDLIGRFDGVADFITLDDGFARRAGDGLDAVLLANWLAARSRGIGIIAGAPVNVLEPFHISTAIATLDYVSEGRAGLLAQRLGETQTAEAARAIGTLQGFPGTDGQALDRDALEAVEVIRRLWDSWEDDAVIRDVESQRFLDAAKLHYIDFEGSGFRVLGPSITPRPPQGRPVVAAGWSKGEDLALAVQADVVFLQVDASELAGAVAAFRNAAGPQPFLVADIAIDPGTTAPAVLVPLVEQTASHGVQGIRLTLSDPQRQAEPLLSQALPALREAGLIGEPAGGTLRSRFGLPPAANRYVAAA